MILAVFFLVPVIFCSLLDKEAVMATDYVNEVQKLYVAYFGRPADTSAHRLS